MNTVSNILERPIKRTVALAAATGLVGRSILDGLLRDTSVLSVHVLGRRKPRVVQLTCHVVDFGALPPLPPIDEVYLALGDDNQGCRQPGRISGR